MERPEVPVLRAFACSRVVKGQVGARGAEGEEHCHDVPLGKPLGAYSLRSRVRFVLEGASSVV